MEFTGTVEGLYVGISAEKQFLHKGILIVLFCMAIQNALNLADCQFSNRRNRIAGSPHDEKETFAFFCYFIQTAGSICKAKCSAVSKILQLGF